MRSIQLQLIRVIWRWTGTAQKSSLFAYSSRTGDKRGPDYRHLQNDARHRVRSSQAGSDSSLGPKTRERGHSTRQAFRQDDAAGRFGALRDAFAGKLLAECGRDRGTDSAHRWRLLLAGAGDFDCSARQPANASEMDLSRDWDQG